MHLTGMVIGFELGENDSLRNLLKQGYSKPEKTEFGGGITRKDTYLSSESVEVERRDPNVFVTIRMNVHATPTEVGNAIKEVLADFYEAELLK